MSLLYIILLSIGLQDSAKVSAHLEKLNKAYNTRSNIHMKVKYSLYKDGKAATPSEIQNMESWRMGNDNWYYKGKGWEFIQIGNMTLRVDHEAKVLQLQGTYVPKENAVPQDPMAQIRDFLTVCKSPKISGPTNNIYGIRFECLVVGYSEVDVKYNISNCKIKSIGLTALPGKALGDEGGKLKIDFLEEEPWTDKSKFKFSAYLQKEGDKYKPIQAYAAYKFIDQSYLFKKNENQ